MSRIIYAMLFLAALVLRAQSAPITVNALGIPVSKVPRQFVSTNKEAGTYYSEALSPNSGGWFGWFVNAEKIMHDYELTVNGQAANRAASNVTVYPHQTVRRYRDGTRETFTLADSINALIIEVRSPESKLGLTLSVPENFIADTTAAGPGRTWRKTTPSAFDAVPSFIVLAPFRTSAGMVFVVSAEKSLAAARRQADSVFANRTAIIQSRHDRMNRILSRAAITADDTRLTTAFAWAVLSMDALIMRQAVNGVPTKGIFAGLPWFNNYWGRDSFISLPGATYVIGNFSDARDVLRSYARFQETDTASTNYGRIPNLATPTSVQYNTADGTPWFVKGVWEYARASADTGFLREMYPVILRSIDGTLRYHTDSLFFLTHADAETWMDAVGPDGPWSPRGTRANDIQALWHDQLTCASDIARIMDDAPHASAWTRMATTLAGNFQRRFTDGAHGLLFDHLRADGSAARELRPNQLFCLDLIADRALQRSMTEQVLSSLVYAHGTGTLSQLDTNFTPYHHYEPYYVQDAAYHNGIVWTWLNGAAIRAAARFNLQNTVYPVTLNMVHQIIDRGCVGALSELLDAHSRPGEREPRLSGTYSQAWSLAEFIRSMYEDYLGARLDAVHHVITLSAKLPTAIKTIAFPLATPEGIITVEYKTAGGKTTLSLHSKAAAAYTIHYTRQDESGMRVDTSIVLGMRENAVLTTHAAMQTRGETVALAKPVLVPYLKLLKGPSYPMLTLKTIGAENALASVLFNADDATGDDRGPSGTYTYPSSVHLKAGSLDLTHARVRYDRKNVYFTLTFSALSNPGWHPEYGFQLTLAAIAIHRSKENTETRVGVNSKMTLDSAHAFDRMLVVGGGYRLTDAQGTVLCEYRPRPEDVKHPMGDPRTRTIQFAVPVEFIGTPTKEWTMTIMAGAQDDHGGAGVGEFRAVDLKGGEWTGGGKADPAGPNVYDVLVLE